MSRNDRRRAKQTPRQQEVSTIHARVQDLLRSGISHQQVLATIAGELNRSVIDVLRWSGAPVVTSFIGFIGPDGQAQTACFAGAMGGLDNANELIVDLCAEVEGSVRNYAVMGVPKTPATKVN